MTKNNQLPIIKRNIITYVKVCLAEPFATKIMV